MTLPILRFVQLPIPQPALQAATANVPLAAGCLAVAVREEHLPVEVEVLSTDATDALGDALLAEQVAAGEPAFVALSLYLWNVERSLALARAVRRRSPRTRILVGGPEVSIDNPYLVAAGGFDVALNGEAEEALGPLIRRLLSGASLDALPGVILPRADGTASHTPPVPASFPLTRFPSPYLSGVLAVDGRRSTYVETVRGCRSHCTFCFYPRSSAVLRTLDPGQCRELLVALRDQGAREVVFLDPTFNHRPDFDALLDVLVEVNRGRSLQMFAEVRAEGLTESQMDRLALAGFHKLEIGLQSVNPRTLAATRRGGNPATVAAAAHSLRRRGIDLLVDLIVGLPGDTRRDVQEGVELLVQHELESSAQVFPLSVLPGTAMRSSAAADGLEYEALPPYRVRRTRTMEEGEIRAAFTEAEERLGRSVDEVPRPSLCDPRPGPVPATWIVDLDHAGRSTGDLDRGGASHGTLWLKARDLWLHRERVRSAVAARLRVDPFAVLDVVLSPELPVPVNLLELLEQDFAAAPASYASRSLAHRGVDAQHRIALLQGRGLRWPSDYEEFLGQRIPFYRDQSLEQALAQAEALGETVPRARILDREVPDQGLQELAERAAAEAVAFADFEVERRFVEEFLRYLELGA